jgi:membrane protein
VKTVVEILTDTYESWRDDRAIRLGAALAYYGLFAIIPLLVTAIGIAGMVFSSAQIQSYFAEILNSGLNDELASAIETVADAVSQQSTSGGVSLLGVVSGLFAASLVFAALQDSLNMIWGIPVRSGLRQSVRRRMLSFAVVFVIGGVLVGVLAVQAIILVAEGLLPVQLDGLDILGEIAATVASWGLGIGALAVLFQILVHKHLAWHILFVASTIVSVMLVVGTWALGFYFDRFGSTSIAGVAGGLLIILVWLYYEAQILIAGAELLKTLDDRQDTPDAVED